MDIISPSTLDHRDVERHLGELSDLYRIRTLSESSSTNDDVKAAARAGEPEGLVIIADRQTAGRGRLRRPFFSPDGSGLYMSILLRPDLSPADSVLITAAAAVAVAAAVEQVSGRFARIKWGQRHLSGRQKGLRHPDGGRCRRGRETAVRGTWHRRQRRAASGRVSGRAEGYRLRGVRGCRTGRCAGAPGRGDPVPFPPLPGGWRIASSSPPTASAPWCLVSPCRSFWARRSSRRRRCPSTPTAA